MLPKPPQHLLPSKCFPRKPSRARGLFSCLCHCQAAFPPPPHPSPLLPLIPEGDLLFSLRNLLGMNEAGCKPRFSSLRWFKRPQFVELLHEYLMIIFLGHLEAKNEGIDYPVTLIRGWASSRWGRGGRNLGGGIWGTPVLFTLSPKV